MIIQRCDLCNKQSSFLQSMVLHKKTIDYCSACKEKAEQIKEDFRQVIKQEYMIYESRLRKAEQDFYYKKIKKYE